MLLKCAKWQVLVGWKLMKARTCTSELKVSGLINQGVPSSPRSFLGKVEGSKNAAKPKSAQPELVH